MAGYNQFAPGYCLPSPTNHLTPNTPADHQRRNTAAYNQISPGYWNPNPLNGIVPYARQLITTAPQTPAGHAWQRVKSGLQTMTFDRSFAVPRDYWEWRALQDQAQQARTRVAVRRILANNRERAFINKMDNRFQLRILNGDHDELLSDGRSAVLGQPTIWQPYYASCMYQSPWPPCTEFKHEGNERFTSHMDRFLPFPRMHRNETCNWQYAWFKPQWPLDETLPHPWAPRYFHSLNELTNFPSWNTINDPLESNPRGNLDSVWHHIERTIDMLDGAEDDY